MDKFKHHELFDKTGRDLQIRVEVYTDLIDKSWNKNMCFLDITESYKVLPGEGVF